jgi:hypothetical protein
LLFKPVAITEQTVLTDKVATPGVAPESISVALGRRNTRHRGETGEEPPPKKAKVAVKVEVRIH